MYLLKSRDVYSLVFACTSPFRIEKWARKLGITISQCSDFAALSSVVASSAVPKTQARPLPQWQCVRGGYLPVAWFGANSTGFENPAQVPACALKGLAEMSLVIPTVQTCPWPFQPCRHVPGHSNRVWFHLLCMRVHTLAHAYEY